MNILEVIEYNLMHLEKTIFITNNGSLEINYNPNECSFNLKLEDECGDKTNELTDVTFEDLEKFAEDILEYTRVMKLEVNKKNEN